MTFDDLLSEVKELNKSVDAGNEVNLETAIAQKELVNTFVEQFGVMSSVLQNIQLQLEINSELQQESAEVSQALVPTTEDVREDDRIQELQSEYLEDTALYVRKLYEFMVKNQEDMQMDYAKASLMGAVGGIAESAVLGRAGVTAASALAGGAAAKQLLDKNGNPVDDKDGKSSKGKGKGGLLGALKKVRFGSPQVILGTAAVAVLTEVLDIDFSGLKKRLNDLTFEEAVQGLSDAVSGVFTGLYDFVVDDQGGFGSALFSAVKGAMAGTILGIPGMIGGAILGGLAGAIGQDRIDQFTAEFTETLRVAWENIKQFFSNAIDQTIAGLLGFGEDAVDFSKEVGNDVVDFFTPTPASEYEQYRDPYVAGPETKEEWDQLIQMKVEQMQNLQQSQITYTGSNPEMVRFKSINNSLLPVQQDVERLQAEIADASARRDKMVSGGNVSAQTILQNNNNNQILSTPKTPYSPTKRAME